VTSWLLGGELGPEGTLVWTAPDWVVIVAAVGALVAWVAATGGARALGARALELGLWGLALAGLVAAVAGPVWVEEEGRTEAGRVAVLVDGSRSMGVIEDGHPRSDVVAEVLEHIREQVGEADVFHFGDDLLVGPPDAY
jgi:hypothetical protein